jgi:predicted Fe-Mo cluster-binding NifX family protein
MPFILGGSEMKIAIPYNEGRVNEHFGQSREFVIYTVTDGKISNKKVVGSEEFCHNHEGLAGLLRDEQVGVVIAGGIGRSMMIALQAMGLKTVTGATGDTARVAEDYAGGRLVTSNIEICSCGGEH